MEVSVSSGHQSGAVEVLPECCEARLSGLAEPRPSASDLRTHTAVIIQHWVVQQRRRCVDGCRVELPSSKYAVAHFGQEKLKIKRSTIPTSRRGTGGKRYPSEN